MHPNMTMSPIAELLILLANDTSQRYIQDGMFLTLLILRGEICAKGTSAFKSEPINGGSNSADGIYFIPPLSEY